MIKDTKTYQVLLIEDNPGDVLLIEEYIKEYIRNPVIIHFDNFEQAKELLAKGEQELDVILLDLTLPNMQGEELIRAMLEISGDIPVIVLTGLADMVFSIRSLEIGVSDYLLKDDLTGFSLYKSILHNINRKKYIQELQQSKKRYNDLFHHSPQPMWVYDLQTLRILDVNIAAEEKYGYSREEFLAIDLRDLRDKARIPELEKNLELISRDKVGYQSGQTWHRKKNGDLFPVEIHGNRIEFGTNPCRIITANDLSEIHKKTEAITEKNRRLQEIAWTQSHLVRAPLARLLGLLDLLDYEEVNAEEKEFCLTQVRESAREVDEIIHKIVKKTEQIDLDEVLYEDGDPDH